MSAEYVTETLSANLSDRLAECCAEVAKLRERLRLTAQILAEEFVASGPANADDLARIAAAEVARLREVSREYIHALAVIRAENDRYRAALVEITNHATMLKTDPDHPELYWLGIAYLVGEIASRTLTIRTESGQLSDDSGQIAGDGK